MCMAAADTARQLTPDSRGRWRCDCKIGGCHEPGGKLRAVVLGSDFWCMPACS